VSGWTSYQFGQITQSLRNPGFSRATVQAIFAKIWFTRFLTSSPNLGGFLQL